MQSYDLSKILAATSAGGQLQRFDSSRSVIEKAARQARYSIARVAARAIIIPDIITSIGVGT